MPPGFAVPRVAAGGSGALPAELQAAIAGAYRELGERCGLDNPAVAVRSSAVDEDGKQNSFAGMHDTYLNILGVDALLEAIQKTWASATSERAIAYRRRNGLPLNNIQIAALVQQLVLADIASVAFSRNPVSGSQDEIVITASWGLGASVVEGTVTPDTVRVRKSDLAILSQDIGRKLRMTVAVPGGTQEVGVPRFLQDKACLGENQAQAIARMARQLEAEMGSPIDIECAIADGELYLLQCRPVTG